jgi:hypothetical protein
VVWRFSLKEPSSLLKIEIEEILVVSDVGAAIGGAVGNQTHTPWVPPSPPYEIEKFVIPVVIPCHDQIVHAKASQKHWQIRDAADYGVPRDGQASGRIFFRTNDTDYTVSFVTRRDGCQEFLRLFAASEHQPTAARRVDDTEKEPSPRQHQSPAQRPREKRYDA